MAELYQAYGYSENESFSPKNDFYEEKHEVEKPVYKEHVQQKHKEIVSQPTQEFAPVVQQNHLQAVKRHPSYSFSDRMSMKRGEVMKLAIFSLVIVLAIALDRMSTHYLTKYLTDGIFTDFQEFMLRLSYPIVIFLLLWIVKSL